MGDDLAQDARVSAKGNSVASQLLVRFNLNTKLVISLRS